MSWVEDCNILLLSHTFSSFSSFSMHFLHSSFTWSDNRGTEYSSVSCVNVISYILEQYFRWNMRCSDITSDYFNLIRGNTCNNFKKNCSGELIECWHDLLASSVNVPPSILSDHSMINVELEMRCFQHFSSMYSLRRSWRSFDYSEFENDLISSTLINDTPLDTNELFSAYDNTLRSLLLFDVFAIPSDLHRCGMMLNVVLVDALHGS